MACPSCQFYQEDVETSVGEEYGEEVRWLGLYPWRDYWDSSPFLSISMTPQSKQTSYLAYPKSWCFSLPQAPRHSPKWPWTKTSEATSQNESLALYAVYLRIMACNRELTNTENELKASMMSPSPHTDFNLWIYIIQKSLLEYNCQLLRIKLFLNWWLGGMYMRGLART